MRHALIKDGKVVDIVVVGHNWTPPDDHQLVRSDTGNVGDDYDGSIFKPPAVEAGALRFHALQRYGESPYALHRVSGDAISVNSVQHELLARLAARAQHDSRFSIEWPEARTGRTVTLSAAQIIALNDAITDHWIARLSTLTGLLRGIAAGTITRQQQIDQPPAPIPPWPPRYHEPVTK